GATLLLLEAAPTNASARCDSPVFRARSEDLFASTLRASGFRIERITGVDPMPFRTWVLPYLRSLPGPVAFGAAAAATAVSLPLDLLFADRLAGRSWHKVIVATRR
ncbi:MAG: hypothetical protein R3288_05225, partial [Woeseiaceae bacterium]|nr:hypothetical protein [Woeseiaceae bacterium]